MAKAAICFLLMFSSSLALAQAKVMNAGEGIGQLVVLSSGDILTNSAKFKKLNPLSIAVFDELPMQLAVIAGAITLRQQNFNSHVQLKAIALKTPNLDISKVEGGLAHPMFQGLQDGDWIRLKLEKSGAIAIERSTQEAAIEFRNQKIKSLKPVRLQSDLMEARILPHAELTAADFVRFGSKAANYAELARSLNTSTRTVVRPGYAVPFFYYQEFLELNPEILDAMEALVRDPLMQKVERIEYREVKLAELREMMVATETKMNPELSARLVEIFDTHVNSTGELRRFKLRSSTNSEDLPNFNGAGLYESHSYKPVNKKGKVRDQAGKIAEVEEALRNVWASVWTLRAYEERTMYRIPHLDVKMGIQINPSFSDEGADGVVITKNILNDPNLPGEGVYLESQRGDTFSVANPDSGVSPERVLVLIDAADKLNVSKYRVHTVGQSNVADNGTEILPHVNPNPVMAEVEIKDLVYQSLKAQIQLESQLDKAQESFTLDLEFKVDSEDTGERQVYLKQARPYLDQ